MSQQALQDRLDTALWEIQSQRADIRREAQRVREYEAEREELFEEIHNLTEDRDHEAYYKQFYKKELDRKRDEVKSLLGEMDSKQRRLDETQRLLDVTERSLATTGDLLRKSGQVKTKLLSLFGREMQRADKAEKELEKVLKKGEPKWHRLWKRG